jgi:RHS repeat-associated protein
MTAMPKINSTVAFSLKMQLFCILGLSILCNNFSLYGQNISYQPLYTSSTFDAKQINVNLPVGSIEGVAGVASGASTYTVPLPVPPGTNNVQPQISLTYNSFSGNGILGQGWEVSGLSLITRVNRNLYFDGQVNPIDLTSTDQFVFDGSRLIGKSGVYGSNGASYATEQESFASITSFGSIGGDPMYFTIETKEGVLMEFGNSTDSRFLNEAGTEVLTWRMNKIQYDDGNYIEFKYVNVDRDHRIDEINYTGNSVTGLLPYNKIKFNYLTRIESPFGFTDINTQYIAGSALTNKYLLDKIVITAESSQPFKTFDFKYGHNKTRSQLLEITEKGYNGTLLNATIFKYGDNAVSPLNVGVTNKTNGGQDCDVFPGDFNGDGYTDYLTCSRHINGGGVYHKDIKINKKTPIPGSQSFTSGATNLLNPSAKEKAYGPRGQTNGFGSYGASFFTNDFSGDGASDVLVIKKQSDPSYISNIELLKTENDGNNFAAPITFSLPPSNNKIKSDKIFVFSGDFNGDGINDLVVFLGNNSNTFQPYLYLGGSTIGSYRLFNNTSDQCYFSLIQWANAEDIFIVDFNGDGKDDLMIMKQGQCEIFTLNVPTSGNITPKKLYCSGFPTVWHLLFFGDFNGDGKTDILSRGKFNNNDQWHKAISTGTGFVETPYNFIKTPDINQYGEGDMMLIADLNGDGMSDIAHGWDYNSQSKIDLYYSRGNTFSSEQVNYSRPLLPNRLLYFYDFNADGRSDLFHRFNISQDVDILYFNSFGKENLLEKSKNGMGYTNSWSYKRLTEAGSFYTRGNLTAQPLNSLQLPVNAVYQFFMPTGLGSGFTTIQYAYSEAKFHKEGKGFLGFKRITADNSVTDFRTIEENQFNTTYFTSYPYLSQVRRLSDNSLFSENAVDVSFVSFGSKRFWIKTDQSYQHLAFEGRFIQTTNTWDNIYGNLTQSVTNINNIETVSKSYTYGAYGTPVPSIITSETISYTRSGQPVYNMAPTVYTYNTLGQLTSKKEFDGLSKNVLVQYSYNVLGNLISENIYPNGLAPRYITYIYDPKGRFPTTTKNQLYQNTIAVYDSRWGKATSITDVDGLTTTFQYDEFGRLTQTNQPQGYAITQSYGWDINTSDGTINYHLISHPGKPDTKVWFDLLGRQKKTETQGSHSTTIMQKKTYDAKGNLATSTAPYKSGEPILTTTFSYDFYNRLSQESNTLGTTGYAYVYDVNDNLTVTITNPAGQVSSKTTDASGKLISVTDSGGTLTYTYNSQGNLILVKNGNTTLATNEYDEYKRQTKLIDISGGTISYIYDALGQLATQVDAKSQTTTFTYDVLGRITQRIGAEGTTTYEYYLNGSGGSTNKIKKITGFAGNTDEYAYDSWGRLNSRTEKVDGTLYTTAYSYNTYGDITSTVYYHSNLSVNYYYDSNRYLSNIKNGNNSVTFFTNNGMNGFNQFTSFLLGNGKTSQTTYYFGIPTKYYTQGVQDLNLNWNYQSGNLTSRYDAIKGKTENFAYDNLNRLTSSSGSGLTTISVSYNNNGNITSKTDAGGYTYHPSKIFAVTAVTNPSYIIPVEEQQVTYTPFDQPNQIIEGAFQLDFQYGHDYERRKTILKQHGSTLETRYFFNNYEKSVTQNATKHIHYIHADQQLVAVIVRENGNDAYYYVYSDHLGSVLTVTGNTGNVVAEQNFDAWGRKRNTSNWTYSAVQSVPDWLYRGFTGHEMLPQFGLVNMNGRLYDPVVGRMLSVDNYIQLPGFTQNYNRYSYVLNNPLRFNDPSGELIPAIVIIIGVPVVSGFINLWANKEKLTTFGAGLSYFASGAVGGAVGLVTVNPYAAAAITSVGNIAADIAFGHAPDIKNIGDLASYALPQIGIGLISAGATSAVGKLVGPYLSRFGWFQRVYKEPLAASELADFAEFIDEGFINPYTVVVSNYKGVIENVVDDVVAKTSTQGGLNLFKWDAPQTKIATGWKTGDYMLHLPNKGTPKLNWKANYGAVRREMGFGKPIFESYKLPNGDLIPTGGFLNAERSIFQGRGWIYYPSSGAWVPPGF